MKKTNLRNSIKSHEVTDKFIATLFDTALPPEVFSNKTLDASHRPIMVLWKNPNETEDNCLILNVSPKFLVRMNLLTA